MSALARYFLSRGMDISGYDKTPSPLTHQLEEEGMLIHYEDRPDLIPEAVDLVVRTPAVPDNLHEYRYCVEHNIPLLKRAEVLGLISKKHFTIAIAGTHGKTSVTALIAHLLQHAGIPVLAFIGGIAKNVKSNCIINPQAKILVVEADEFDRSFLHLFPDMLIITAIDADHLDIYGSKNNLEDSFKTFAQQLDRQGTLFLEKNLEPCFSNKFEFKTYGIHEKSDFKATHPTIQNGFQVFDLEYNNFTIEKLQSSLPGTYNLKNITAAFAVAHSLSIDKQLIRTGIETFEGVVRRFDIRYRSEQTVYIDDYAHHPEEIAAFLSAVKTLFPKKKITGIFQPHLYSRTRDFADEFAKSLDQLDEAYLMPVYPAREKPIKGVSSKDILRRMKLKKKTIINREEILSVCFEKQPEILVTLGAGDIDRLVPQITKKLEELQW